VAVAVAVEAAAAASDEGRRRPPAGALASQGLSFAPMPYDNKRPRRPGGGRPPAARSRDFGDRPPRERGSFGDRPPEARGGYPDRGAAGRPPRHDDDGGMSIRLDPRRLSALKLLAAEAGVRPGELVTHWVEERLDAARAGGPAASAAPGGAAIAELRARLETIERRLDALTPKRPAAAAEATPNAAPKALPETPAAAAAPATEAPVDTGGRAPKKQPVRRTRAARTSGPRIGLHEEIAAVIAERGPSTAAEIAAAVVERGRYAPPRSSRPIDASIINSRVSNPVYRARFTRTDGRIGLATSE